MSIPEPTRTQFRSEHRWGSFPACLLTTTTQAGLVEAQSHPCSMRVFTNDTAKTLTRVGLGLVTIGFAKNHLCPF
jgi:hypothetical protein